MFAATLVLAALANKRPDNIPSTSFATTAAAAAAAAEDPATRALLAEIQKNLAMLNKPCDDDICRTGPELISSKGYPVQMHYVTTEDKYILGVIRFSNPNVGPPAGIKPQPGGVKPAVLLQHGLMDSADTWIVNYRNSSLAYILADAGYDVWLGNTRGNKYSRNHTKLNPNPPFNHEFWQYSYDDMAKYDLPGQIDYILKTTGLSQISYVGHSQGTTQVFANLAQPQNRTKYSVQSKLASFVALAPVTYIHHCKSTLLQVVSKLHADQLVAFLGMNEFLLSADALDKMLPGFCKTFPGICDDVLRAIAGYDPSDFDQARWPVYIGHFPTGESCKELEHYAQGIRNETFRMYDYGAHQNQQTYGQKHPPDYNMRSITGPPMALFYAENDDLADPTDVKRLLTELPSAVRELIIYHPTWAHMDYTWGRDAYKIAYPQVLDFIRKHLA